MSYLLIKDMEMPQNCEECDLKVWDEYEFVDYVCPFSGVIVLNIGRQGSCPLVEVPPHGRLGDLDKLEKMFADIDSAPYSCFDGAEPFYSAEDAVNIIRLAPTVIPASEEGET